MKALVIFLITLLLLLQFRLWVGDGSLVEVWELHQAVAEQDAENTEMLTRNNALEAEVKDLKKGQAAIEERARSELGMIQEGETFYQIITPAAEPVKKASYTKNGTECGDEECLNPDTGG
jgi:cell division protein FtsB